MADVTVDQLKDPKERVHMNQHTVRNQSMRGVSHALDSVQHILRALL